MSLTDIERITRVLGLWGVETPAERLLGRADELLDNRAAPMTSGSDTAMQALIVTKGPHAGSVASAREILARVLASGAGVAGVERTAAADAEELARMLYPDVGAQYHDLRLSGSQWATIDRTFDTPDFPRIFGVDYSRDLVIPGNTVRKLSSLTTAELASIWSLGRSPIPAYLAAELFGPEAATVLSPARNPYDWYRGGLPVGIQKISSSVMAFAMRHPRVRSGDPTIIVNGQFTLLAERFVNGGKGAMVLAVDVPGRDAAQDFRNRVIGASDQPRQCALGSIRRDAVEGFFGLDSLEPVTPWSNVVHGSDGYLSGFIETLRIAHVPHAPLWRRLLNLGYSSEEARTLVLSDPLVTADDRRQPLSQWTKGRSEREVLDIVCRLMPPSVSLGGDPSVTGSMVSSLIRTTTQTGVVLEGSVTEAVSRVPGRIASRDGLPTDAEDRGRRSLREADVGLLVPLAGSGGRFGGYHNQEGSAARMKALLPIFSRHGDRVSALDLRVRRTEELLSGLGAQARYFFSYSGKTESHVRAWVDAHNGLDVRSAAVPEAVRVEAPVGATFQDEAEFAGAVLRSPNGSPLTKPIGSFGLLWAAARSGTLAAWADEGVRYVVAANADDVGFCLDAAIFGLLDASPALDAVVLGTRATSEGVGQQAKGGLIRERLADRGWSVYVEENATLAGRTEYFNTNQIYLRLDSLAAALTSPRAGTLPTYIESKEVSVGERGVQALHAYRPYADVLRLLDSVTAVEISPMPVGRQPGGYRPLKCLEDVEAAQRIIDLIDGTEGAAWPK